MKKTAIILGSSNINGNTRQLVAMVEALTPADVFILQDFAISPFDYDHNNSNDDFMPLIEKFLEYNHLAFASPVYWYCMSAQMKVFVDRLSDLLTIHKDLGRRLRGKPCSVISTGVSETAPDCFETAFKLTFDYLGMGYQTMLYGDFSEGVDVDGFKPLVADYVEGISGG